MKIQVAGGSGHARVWLSLDFGATFWDNDGASAGPIRPLTPKAIVEAHDGTIAAENRIERGEVKGARFTVSLPATQ